MSTRIELVDQDDFRGEQITSDLGRYFISSRKGLLFPEIDKGKRIDETCVFDNATGESEIVGLYSSHTAVVATLRFITQPVSRFPGFRVTA